MKRTKCEICGRWILKSAHDDPYICRECEQAIPIEDFRYKYLDSE